MADQKEDVVFTDNTAAEHTHGTGNDWMKSTEGAKAANEKEHTTSIRKALRENWKAVSWSLIVSMSIIMEGYDTQLIFSFFAFPPFQKQFGEPFGDGYQVPGRWQSALSGGLSAGAIVGALLNGFAIKRFGYKPTFIVSLCLMCALIFIPFFSKTIELQTVGQVLCGLPWGVFATIGPAYASEILPLALRPYLTSYTNMCFAIGQFVSAGVLQSYEGRPGQWSYRIPFALQWMWPAPLFAAALFMPESPWWLARAGKYDSAEQTLLRLSSGMQQEEARKQVAMMVHTNEIEKELVAGSSYLDCFGEFCGEYRGTNLRRTEIACICFAGQVAAGSNFAYSPTFFFTQAGLSANNAYKLALGGTAIAFVGTVISWFLMRAFGRRPLYIGGMGMMTLLLLLVGILQAAAHSSPNAVWGQAALCIIWLFTFSLSVGPVGWTIPAEVSSTRLRSKTVVLGRNTYYVINLAGGIIEPYLISPTEGNWKGYTGFFWAGSALIWFVWAIFRLPESKGRTFEELDVMFGARLPTRHFKRYHVDAYAEDLSISDRAQLAEPKAAEKQ